MRRLFKFYLFTLLDEILQMAQNIAFGDLEEFNHLREKHKTGKGLHSRGEFFMGHCFIISQNESKTILF